QSPSDERDHRDDEAEQPGVALAVLPSRSDGLDAVVFVVVVMVVVFFVVHVRGRHSWISQQRFSARLVRAIEVTIHEGASRKRVLTMIGRLSSVAVRGAGP